MTNVIAFDQVLNHIERPYLDRAPAQPFIKWAGDKRAIMPYLAQHFLNGSALIGRFLLLVAQYSLRWWTALIGLSYPIPMKNWCLPITRSKMTLKT